MRFAIKSALLLTAVATIVSVGACDDFFGTINEGVNVHDLGGTIVIPKSQIANAADIGAIYVGVYSGVNNANGYTGPIVAPQTGDAFPYGGTSIGAFYTRDARYICQAIDARTVRDAGANWELDFQVLQFDFYKGSTVWAFEDHDAATCNAAAGFYDIYSIFAPATSVTALDASNFDVAFSAADLTSGNLFDTSHDPPGPNSKLPKTEFIDANEKIWRVVSSDYSVPKLRVTDFYHYHSVPVTTGPFPARLTQPDTFLNYGTQFQDTLNSPQKYLVASSNSLVSQGLVINDTSNITILLDTKKGP